MIDTIYRFFQHDGKMSEVLVSGAFHTPLMKSALPVLSRALNCINVKTPEIQVYSNVTAAQANSRASAMAENNEGNMSIELRTNVYEVGPGRQLAAVLVKPISLPRHT